MVRIAESNLPDRIKEELLNEAIEKWKTTNEILLELGISLED